MKQPTTLALPSLVALAALVAVSGCKEEEDNATFNELAVQQTAGTAFQATQTAAGGDGQSGAFAMMGVGTAALGLVVPEGGQSIERPPHEPDVAYAAQQGTGCECTANSCTFTACGNGTGLTIEGSISWTETSLDCDYTVSGDQGGSTYDFSIFCDIDYTQTSIDGVIETAGRVDVPAAGANGTSSWDTSMTFDQVTFANGQPTGGSIEMSASVTAGGETYRASGSVAF